MGPARRVAIEQLATDFPREELIGQFVLGAPPDDAPAGWTTEVILGWPLARDPSLPLLRLTTVDGEPLGALLGHPIDVESSTLPAGTMVAPLRSGDPDVGARLVRWLATLGGRFVALELAGAPRVHPDAYASLPVFWDEGERAVASSPFLVRRDPASLEVRQLYRVQDPWSTGRVLGFGLTPFVGIEHLMANHVLDLTHWRQERTWPVSSFTETTLEDSSQAIGDVVERTMRAVAASGTTPCMGLTAGGDSRVILAAAREVAAELRFVTFSFPDGLGTTDLLWSRRIAKAVGLRHELVPYRVPDERDVALFAFRTGGMNGDLRGRYAAPTYRQLQGWSPYVGGANGGMLRGQEWPRKANADDRLDAEAVVESVGLLSHPELVERAAAWLATLPPLHALDVRTLASLEAHDCAWTGTLTLAFQEGRPAIAYPLTHRAVIDACLRTPWQIRRADALRRSIIVDRWPELLAFPFNRAPFRVSVRHRFVRGARLTRSAVRHAGRLVRSR